MTGKKKVSVKASEPTFEELVARKRELSRIIHKKNIRGESVAVELAEKRGMKSLILKKEKERGDS